MSTYRSIAPITHQRDVFSEPVSALCFDPVSDTLWAGSDSGQVAAYYGVTGTRGVFFRIGGNLPVKKIVAGENYVRASAMSGEGIGCWSKGGVNRWLFRWPHTVTAFSNEVNSSQAIAVATSTPELLFVHSTSGTTIREAISIPSIITQLQFSHSLLFSGSADGYLRTHDPRTGMKKESGENSTQAHPSGIQGMQISGNYVSTVGWGVRHSRPFPDPLVKVWDVRTMRALPAIPFPSGPAFINTLPRRSSSIAITSNQGLINIVDVSNPGGASEFYQIDTASYVSSVSISPTGVYMALGDAEGMIHLLSAVDEGSSIPFNGFDGQPIVWADHPEPLPDIEWTDHTPLNLVGLPHYTERLLSSWTPQFIPPKADHPPPAKIPPQVLSTMKMNDNVAYAALPKDLKGRRNMVIVSARNERKRFRSGKSHRHEMDDETPAVDLEGDEIPRMYRQVEIAYSKFGVEDFDFGFYNKTDYSGLETDIQNSYTNALLQVIHYTLPIRQLAKSHITTNCPREHCLLCELGFIVRILEDARGTNCQASNFCKTVGVLAAASNAIELIDYGGRKVDVDYAHTIQSFHRFLVDHLTSEGNAFPHNPMIVKQATMPAVHSPAAAPITQLLGIDAKNVITCLSCKAIREKENMTHIVEMIYPRKSPPNDPPTATDFSTILRNSLLRQMTHKATCQTCKQFSTFSSRRSIRTRDLPPILAINASIYNDQTLEFWLDVRGQTFLNPQVEIQGQVEGVDDPEIALYNIRAIVVQIVTNEKKSHLVSIVKIPESEGDNESPWILFNDFVVCDITEGEALTFPGKWKVPAILYMERAGLHENLDFSGLPDEIDSSILSRDTSISLNRDESLMEHECLRFQEMPTPGTFVAIDTEFVSMQQEETEFRSDGTNRVLRPARLSLARVSVLRGDGPKQGVPFIDDYIHTSEIIVDYLTQFSGIKFGDLDPQMSRYSLTPLKLVYKKLRVLVDRGCIFIGHGLSKDFRIINLFVPPDQIIDTVDLYFLKSRQRRLSLRFLSWFVLQENIQTDAHDSIEDARCALRLYKAYQEFEETGTFDQKLEELYRQGKQFEWKPPTTSVTATVTAPAPSNPPPQFPLRNQQLPFSTQTYPQSNSPPNIYRAQSSPFGQSWSRGHR